MNMDTVDLLWLQFNGQSPLECLRLHMGFMFGNWAVTNVWFGTA